ncbi:MAG: hypothetical protein MZV65_36680 [Chromatiales bacterium]|nr:hypothetical protein [Chromatiales bacterium]
MREDCGDGPGFPATLERDQRQLCQRRFARAGGRDLVWRLRWQERWLYVYLLLEFQSRVDASWRCGCWSTSSGCSIRIRCEASN